ncbi:MAG: hypothetical protein J3K34DRAFT_382443 [Monoraphidium minutum]|nr:MAG: hypothetical protein J3K34DRAFT_382443 [Monoraphidium minutum]
MDTEKSKRLMRQIMKRVHPDLFTDFQAQRAQNSESLKALNAYVEQLGRGLAPGARHLDFWVRAGAGAAGAAAAGGLARVAADLPSGGALEPLFHAFGLITDDELAAGLAVGGSRRALDTNFISWLRATVSDAVLMAERHEDMKLRIREARAGIEHKHQLASLQVGSEFSANPAEQQRQLEALRVLDAALDSLSLEEGLDFSGLHFHAYHPDAPPLGDGSGGGPMAVAAGADGVGYVGDDGCLHVVSDRHTLRDVLMGLDLERARVLTRVSMFWLRRVRDLTPALTRLLGVQNVWCDTRTEQNSQNFVIWAGYVLEQRSEIEVAVAGRLFTFSLLVHSDATSPMIDFSAKSSILQVRSDCPPKQLVEFLVSDGSMMADQAAAAVQVGLQEEHALLEQIRDAFGAKHVVRVCGSTSDGGAVIDGARRLLENAEAIKGSGVDLRGASLAIDDCYEVWGSGFISIPYDFDLKDLRPQLQRMLSAGGDGGDGAGAERQHNTVAAARRGGVAMRAAAGAGPRAAPAFGGWGLGAGGRGVGARCEGCAPVARQQRGTTAAVAAAACAVARPLLARTPQRAARGCGAAAAAGARLTGLR